MQQNTQLTRLILNIIDYRETLLKYYFFSFYKKKTTNKNDKIYFILIIRYICAKQKRDSFYKR